MIFAGCVNCPEGDGAVALDSVKNGLKVRHIAVQVDHDEKGGGNGCQQYECLNELKHVASLVSGGFEAIVPESVEEK